MMRRSIALILSLILLVTALPALAQEPGSIVDVAADDPELTTFVSALDAAGLMETLASNGPYTVFAPTDSAFEALLAASNLTTEALFADPATLSDLLMYHVVAGEVPSNTLATSTLLAGLNEGDILVAATNEGILLNNSAQVLRADIPARNGVIHVIDQVLVPVAPAPMPTMEPMVGSAFVRVALLSSDMPEVDIYINGVLRGEASLSGGQVSDWSALPASTYDFTFVPQGGLLEDAIFGPVSVSVPADSWTTVVVLGSTAEATLQIALLNEDVTAPLEVGNARVTFFNAVEQAGALNVSFSEDLILFNNVDYGEFATLDVPTGDYNIMPMTISTPTPLGTGLPNTTLEADAVYFIAVSGNALTPIVSIKQVTAAEVEALSASILTPTADPVAMADSADVIDVLSVDGRFGELLAAVEMAGLTQMLRDAETLTIFAPTDEAFAALPTGMVDTLAANPDALANLLLYHVVLADVTFPVEAAPLTALGVPLPVDMSGPTPVLNGGAQVIETDRIVGNGRIHVIDAVLVPPTE